jgi:hypothetical protein
VYSLIWALNRCMYLTNAQDTAAAAGVPRTAVPDLLTSQGLSLAPDGTCCDVHQHPRLSDAGTGTRVSWRRFW